LRETANLSAFFPSIRWKIALLMGATVALTLLLICVGLIWQQNRESRALLSSDLQRASRLLSSRLEQLQDRTTRAARSVTVIPQVGPAIADGVTEIESTKLLQMLIPLTAIHDVTDIVVVDAKGKVVAGLKRETPRLPGAVDTEYHGIVLGSEGGKNHAYSVGSQMPVPNFLE